MGTRCGPAEELATRLGIRFWNGFVMDSTLSDGDVHDRRADGTLVSHPIIDGRGRSERIDSLTAFTGQGFRLASAGAPLQRIPAGEVLLLPEEAWNFSKDTPRQPAAGMLQGALLTVGRGRVAVFGKAAMFSAQLSGPDRMPAGFNVPSAPQNAQFALNVLHWLSGLLPPR